MILILGAFAPGAGAAVPELTRVVAGPGLLVKLEGEFGERCLGCEVVVDYGRDFRYAYPGAHWEPNKILVRLDDLNRGTDVTVRVRTQAGTSNALPYRLLPRLVPVLEDDQPVSAAVVDNRHVFERSHRLTMGDRGEDRFEVSVKAPVCGQQADVFDHARLVFKDRRFGEAKIVDTPEAGCSRCRPLTVRWYHEPTGYLAYQLHVYRRTVEGICPARVR